MLGRIDELVIDCAEPAVLARFWSAVLGGRPVDRSPDWSYVDPPDQQPRIAFQQVPEAKPAGKNRLHLDVCVDDIDKAREQLVSLGAESVGEVQVDEQGAFQVMRDPEGNEFCLVR